MVRARSIHAAFIATVVVLAVAACSRGTTTTPPTQGGIVTNQGTTASGGPVFGLPKDPRANIKQAGLPELPEESFVVHVHSHLDLNINGKAVPVPANIGIVCEPLCGDPGALMQSISPLHTHDDTGILHVEAENPDTITLGQFFTEWGVKLDKTCVATYCTDDKNQLLGYVNGQLVPDPASIPITDKAEIYIWYGPKDMNPKPLVDYDWKT